MKNWRVLKPGASITFRWDDFDGKGSKSGVVEVIDEEHVIVRVGDEQLWLDDDTADMFEY